MRKITSLNTISIFSAVATGSCTCIIDRYGMPTKLIIRYDLLVLLNFYTYDVAIPIGDAMNI